MSVHAANAHTFVRDIVATGTVWIIEDAAGIPAPLNADGVRAMPFWSSKNRAETVIATATEYGSFRPRSIPLAEWEQRWLPGLERDNMLAGLNWIGVRARGYDVEPSQVQRRLEHFRLPRAAP